jgi:16S rRNA (guanine966-N2)-methyltransferase
MARNHRSGRDNAVQKARGRAGDTPAAGRNEVRIVGGRWRGRKIRFPTAQGLRPSPDRVRETLFNWLAPVIQGARCLDLFAGSGALGFEALSRGAAAVVLVERNRQVADHLRQLATTLGADGAEVAEADALAWLDRGPGPFDVVFVDPPFGSGLLAGALQRLDRPGRLAPGAFVYLEGPAAEGPPSLPAGWALHRSGRAGDVGYYLAVKRETGPAAAPPEPPASDREAPQP